MYSEGLFTSVAAQGRWVSATTAGLTILISIVIFFCRYRFKTKRSSNPELPPGPSPWPIIGNLHMLGELPHRALKDLADTYGPIMFLKLGSVPAIVVSSPEMAKEFLKTKDLLFASRPSLAVGKYLFYNFRDVALAPYGDYWRQMRKICVLGSVPAIVVSSPEMAKEFLKTKDLLFASRPSLAVGKYLFYNFRDVALAPYGDYWRQMRKICVLELLTAKRIESFQSVREEEVSEMIRSIRQESENGAKAVNVSKMLLSLTANIICRTLLGRKCSTEAPAGIKGLAELMREMSALVGAFYIGDFIPSLGWLDLKGIRKGMKKVNREFTALVDEIIDERIERRKQNGRANNDFVDVLLDISESPNSTNIISNNDMKAILLDTLSGGSDTSGVTLEWAMSEMLRNPSVMKKVQEELELAVGKDGWVKPCDLPRLEYLQCVVKETLRLHSPVPLLLPHEAMEVCTVAGYRIPAKTRLIVNAWAIGRDPAVWGDDSLAFKPERFMPGGRHRNVDVRGQDFELIPFGSGRRGCPGIALALEVVGLALAQLLHCFSWTLECRDEIREELNMSEAYGVAMPPRFQIFAVPTPRLQADL